MSISPNLSQLFFEKPLQWGLRGDPYLWEAMKGCGKDILLPTSVEDMQGLLKEYFRRLVGEDVQKGAETYVKSFDQGGMSGGLVSHDFWLETVFPLLISRWQTMKEGTTLGN